MIKTIRYIIILFILLSAIILPLSILFKANITKIVIKPFIENIITKNAGLKTNIVELTLSFPLVIKVKNINFLENEEKIATVKDLYINISPSLLHFWRINISELSVEELHISNTPQRFSILTGLSSESGIVENIAYKLFNPNIYIDNFCIKKIIIDKSLVKEEEDTIFTLDSRLSFNNTKQKLEFFTKNQLLSKNYNFLENNKFSAFGSYDFNKDEINIKRLNLYSDRTKISGNLLIGMLSKKIYGELKYQTSILEDIISQKVSVKNTDLNGNIKINGEFSNNKIEISGNLLVDLDDNTYFQTYPLSWKGSFLFNQDSLNGNIELLQNEISTTGDITYKDSKIYLQNFTSTAPNFEKTADLIFDIDQYLLTGSVAVKDSTMETSKKFFPFLDSGGIDLRINYFFSENKTQQISIDGKIEKLSSRFANLELLDINVKIIDLWNLKLNNSTLLFKNFSINDILFDTMIFDAISYDHNIKLNSSFSANNFYKTKLNFDSLIDTRPDNFNITFNDVFGTIKNTPFKNSQDIHWDFSKDNTLQVKDFILGNGTINLDLNLLDSNIEASANFNNISTNIFVNSLTDNFERSVIDGNINVSGNVALPIVENNITISKIILDDVRDDISCKISSNIKNNKTNINLEVFDKSEKVIVGNLALPSKFSIVPFHYVFDKESDISGNLEILREFDIISLLPVLSYSTFKGNLVGSIHVKGTINNPEFFGSMGLNHGEYEYLPYGLLLKNINSRIILNKNLILFNKIVANDLMGNELVTSGVISLDENINFHFDIVTDRFHIISLKHLDGDIKVDIKVEGDKNSAKATGKIFLGPADIKILDHYEETIPSLNITKIVQSNKNIDIQDTTYYKLIFDIQLEVLDKVYIKGRGIESKVEGDLHITGQSSNPVINGNLYSVYGQYIAFGKLLKVQEGTLSFDNSIYPYINIVGVRNVDHHEIRVTLSGPIYSPTLKLDSNSLMTQEEILSILLFESNLENISLSQLLLLTSEIQSLSGSGKKVSLLGIARQIFRLDDVNFVYDINNFKNNFIKIGKRFSDNIYFEVESGRQEVSANAKIEIQLTPKIFMENIVQKDGDISFGINWRFDY